MRFFNALMTHEKGTLRGKHEAGVMRTFHGVRDNIFSRKLRDVPFYALNEFSELTIRITVYLFRHLLTIVQ